MKYLYIIIIVSTTLIGCKDAILENDVMLKNDKVVGQYFK